MLQTMRLHTFVWSIYLLLGTWGVRLQCSIHAFCTGFDTGYGAVDKKPVKRMTYVLLGTICLKIDPSENQSDFPSLVY